MGKGGSWLAVLFAAALATALLAACGDSGSNSENSNPTAAKTITQKGGSGEKGSRDSDRSKKSEGTDKEVSRSGDSETDIATPLKVSGGGSGQFRAKGGDNSIQNYGEESDESELQEAAEIVHGFYVARAEKRWEKACTYLAKSIIGQLEALAEQSDVKKSQSCGQVLNSFTRPLPASVRRESTIVDAGSFRHDAERGFLIYYDSEGKPYAMPLKDEDGEWKLTLLSATPLG